MTALARVNEIADAVRPFARAVMITAWEGCDRAQVEAIGLTYRVVVECCGDWIMVRRVDAHGDITDPAYGVERAIYQARRWLGA